ncbi:phage capsid protein [Micromonospora sp. STR1s_5]|nr:phage capsid protein [Micromonospora sp. STR1s_5]
MPVDYNLVDELAAQVAGIYGTAELALVERISRRLAAGLGESDWAARKLREVRAVRRAAQLVADELETNGSAALRQAVAEGYRAGSNSAVVDLAERLVGDTGPTARGASERGSRAVQALADALVREVRPLHLAIVSAAESAYRQAIADATARTLTGVQDRRRAAQDAWAALVSQGVTRFTDTSGRQWRLHTWVEMATRTSTARAATKGLTDGLLAAGEYHVYVTDTPGECSICRPWEHLVLDLRARAVHPAVATLEAARAAGLLHPNCRHGVARWIPGTRLSRTTADPAGNAARDRQRAIERHLRHWREREAAALTPDGTTYARKRVDAWLGEMQRHLDANPGLPRLLYREHIGAGHTTPPRRRGSS